MESEKKLNIKDILILTPREQIKKAILEKYSSLDEFAEDIGLYPDSLKQYLRRKKIGSNTFKIKLTEALGMGYDEIVKSEKEQISEYINTIINEIKKYRKEGDIELLKELKNMCFEKEMFQEYAVLLKEMGLLYYYKNEIDKAEENIKLAISYLKIKDDKNYIFYMSQLLYIYVKVEELTKAKNILSQLEFILNTHEYIKCDRMHAVYFYMAIAYRKMRKNDLERIFIMKSMDHARNDKDKGISTISIAASYVLEERYDLALDHYKKALQFFKEDDTYLKNIIYSDMAFMYKMKKDYKKACFYIDKVFNNLNSDILCTANNFLENFIIIKIESGKKNEVLTKLKEIVNNETFEYVYAHRFIDKIGLIIDMVKDDKEFLESLKQFLIDIIKKNIIDNKEMVGKLKKDIGEITMLQMEL